MAYDVNGDHGKHLLKSVHFSNGKQTTQVVELELGRFGPVGIKCEPNSIVFITGDKRYELSLSAQAQMTLKVIRKATANEIDANGTVSQEIRREFQTESLPWSPHSAREYPWVLSIPSGDSNFSYELEVTYDESNGIGTSIRHLTRAKVISRNKQGKVVTENSIYEHLWEETVD